MLQYLHQIGLTVNMLEIADLFLRMSELAADEEIFIPLTPEQKQLMASMQPGAQRVQGQAQVEQLRQQGKVQAIREKGQVDLQNTIVDKSLDHVEGSAPLDFAEARVARNNDVGILQNGLQPVGGD
jgi:hypothetical protein